MGDRTGKVICHRADERWTAEVVLDEEGQEHSVSLATRFATESAAIAAGAQVIAEWKAGEVTLRDLLLRELAATYRTLRQRHKTMHPPMVPATRSSWELAIGRWEELGWIESVEAGRYREHVECAFEKAAAKIRRHRLLDVGPD
jgi:hypothetical protein